MRRASSSIRANSVRVCKPLTSSVAGAEVEVAVVTAELPMAPRLGSGRAGRLGTLKGIDKGTGMWIEGAGGEPGAIAGAATGATGRPPIMGSLPGSACNEGDTLCPVSGDDVCCASWSCVGVCGCLLGNRWLAASAAPAASAAAGATMAGVAMSTSGCIGAVWSSGKKTCGCLGPKSGLLSRALMRALVSSAMSVLMLLAGDGGGGNDLAGLLSAREADARRLGDLPVCSAAAAAEMEPRGDAAPSADRATCKEGR